MRTVAVAGLLVVLSTTACIPLYLPPVPTTLPPLGERTRITSVAVDVLDDGTVTVRMQVDEIVDADWLAVQWFAPSGPARASEARWIERDDVPLEASFTLPDRVALDRNGRWRVVVTFGRDVVGQREWLVER